MSEPRAEGTGAPQPDRPPQAEPEPAPLSFRRVPDVPIGEAALQQASRPSEPFRYTTAIVLFGLATLSLVGSLIYGAFAADFVEVKSFGTDTFSRSAIGHEALKDTLEELGVSVVVSRHGSGRKSRPGAPLVIAEPSLLRTGDVGLDGTPLVFGLRELIQQTSRSGGSTVVILPKWEGVSDLTKDGWVVDVAPVPVDEILEVIADASDGTVVDGAIVRTNLDNPSWANRLPAAYPPTLGAAQLIERHEGLEPIVDCEDGLLVAKVRGQPVYLVADPDLMNTGGLHKDQNANIFVSGLLIGELGAETVVIDETLHGYFQAPSMWRELLTFPLILVTVHIAMLLGFALWMSIGRFGKPTRRAPRLPPGKEAIVESTSALLTYSEKHGESIMRYYTLRLQQAAHDVGLPAKVGELRWRDELEMLARARGATEDYKTLEEDVQMVADRRPSKKECVALAIRTHRLCQEIVHGHQ